MKKPSDKPIYSKFLDQGTFGCIYKPDIPCDNEKASKSKGYISKLQRKTTEIDKEEIIGKRIVDEIPGYSAYFAPIISSCSVKIDAIQSKEAAKCKIVSDSDSGTEGRRRPRMGSKAADLESVPQGKDSEQIANSQIVYKSYKMRYAGRKSLGKHMVSIIKKNPKNIIKKMLEQQLYILKSVEKLNTLSLPIVHYDLKENNIIYDDVNGVPIIIDFGLSFDLDVTKPYVHSEFVDKYYVFYEKYPPWCIDIVILSYIVQEIVDYQRRDIHSTLDAADIKDLHKICREFVETSDVFTAGFSTDELESYLKHLLESVSGYLDKQWNDLFQDLQKGYASWDNYSVAVIYLFFIHDIVTSKKKINNRVLDNYRAVLKNVVLGGSLSNSTTIESESVAFELQRPSRPTAKQTIDELKTLQKNTDKKEYEHLRKEIDTIIRLNPSRTDDIETSIHKRALQGANRDEKNK